MSFTSYTPSPSGGITIDTVPRELNTSGLNSIRAIPTFSLATGNRQSKGIVERLAMAHADGITLTNEMFARGMSASPIHLLQMGVIASYVLQLGIKVAVVGYNEKHGQASNAEKIDLYNIFTRDKAISYGEMLSAFLLLPYMTLRKVFGLPLKQNGGTSASDVRKRKETVGLMLNVIEKMEYINACYCAHITAANELTKKGNAFSNFVTHMNFIKGLPVSIVRETISNNKFANNDGNYSTLISFMLACGAGTEGVDRPSFFATAVQLAMHNWQSVLCGELTSDSLLLGENPANFNADRSVKEYDPFELVHFKSDYCKNGKLFNAQQCANKILGSVEYNKYSTLLYEPGTMLSRKYPNVRGKIKEHSLFMIFLQQRIRDTLTKKVTRDNMLPYVDPARRQLFQGYLAAIVNIYIFIACGTSAINFAPARYTDTSKKTSNGRAINPTIPGNIEAARSYMYFCCMKYWYAIMSPITEKCIQLIIKDIVK